MASRSSRPKNASRVNREHAIVLLEDGARIEEPAADLLATAERLRAEGIIAFQVHEYVKCVEPRDRDFPPRNRHCTGHIVLVDGQDEHGDDIRCPKCERPVRPYSLAKLRHQILQVTLQRDGAIAWLIKRMGMIGQIRDLGDGAFNVDGLGDMGVVVCVVDVDGRADSKFNKRDFAARSPVLYVTLNPKVAEGRFIKDDWLCRVGLVDLLCGAVDLQQALTDCAVASPAGSLKAIDVPVYAKGHVLTQPVEAPHVGRVFYVEMDASTVRVNGEIVVNPQAGPRLALFRILWNQFLADLSAQKSADEFTAMNMRKLLKAMAEADYSYDDETSLRKVINNLQNDVETAVKKKLGVPISREDIVQTCRMQGQSDSSGGYRINPSCVAIRPSQPR